MDRLRLEALLADGISAAKAGDNNSARDLLLRALEADSASEQGWLWLSSVVESDEDRRICLENVLMLNPDSKPARRGLQKLGMDSAFEMASSQDVVVRREKEPVSLASAVLYPERQSREWLWHDSVPLNRSIDPGFASQTGYADVWETDVEICPYCAGEIHDDDARCPACGRKLVESSYRYQRPTAELTIYWVLLLGIAQLYFVRILVDIAVYGSLFAAAWHAVLFTILILLAAGIFLRRFWAYLASIVALMFILAGMAIGYLSGTGIEDVVSAAIGADFWGSLAVSPVLVLGSPMLQFIVPMQLTAILLALLYGVVKIGPDFERVHIRRVACLDKGLEGASHYYSAGKSYAEQDMWANAIVHWRRAVALEPTRSFYQRVLGEAYARLGFFDRSLDVLGSAQHFAPDEKVKKEIEATIVTVRQASSTGVSAENSATAG
jgi:hypothetical protein